MFARDPKNNIAILQFVPPAEDEAGTTNGTPVDATGFHGLLVIPLVGTIPSAHSVVVKLQDCDTTDGAFVDQDQTDELVAADSDTSPKLSQYREVAGKYCRMSIVRTGTGSSTVGCLILGVNPESSPVDQ